MQPPLQQRCGAGEGHKITGGNGNQKGGGEDLHRHAGAVKQSGEHRDADASQQRHKGVDPLNELRAGGAVVGFHKVLYVALTPEDARPLFIELRLFYETGQAGGLAHGVQLGHFRGALVVAGKHGHGHFQHKGGAVGDPLLIQTEPGIRHTGDKGNGQGGIEAVAQTEQIHDAVDHQSAAQQTGDHQRQHLAENHQFGAAGGDHALGIQGDGGAAEQQDDQVQNHGQLQLAHPHLTEGVVALFRPGHQLPLQLPELGAAV